MGNLFLILDLKEGKDVMKNNTFPSLAAFSSYFAKLFLFLSGDLKGGAEVPIRLRCAVCLIAVLSSGESSL